MASITDYNSLSQAISDFSHRSDLANGLYTDYFLQTAQAKLANDIFANNFGNGIAAMEVAMPPQVINGGTLVVPSDWFAPKAFQILNNGGGVSPLLFKASTWIYSQYPMRQATGLPLYIGRDTMPIATFPATIASNVLTVITGPSVPALTGIIQIGAPINDNANQIISPCSITSQLSGPTGGVGTYAVSNTPDTTQIIQVTAGGNVFVFGPFADDAYTVQGVYYSKGVPLSATNTVNWMVTLCPETLHAYAMIEAGKFLKDDAMKSDWTETAQDFLFSLIERDKAERWGSATMAIQTA